MEELKEKFLVKATASIAEIKEILKVHGEKKIGEVTLSLEYVRASFCLLCIKCLLSN